MKIAVLLGGDSVERDVSIASGKGIIDALIRRGHEVAPIDPALPLEGQSGLALDTHISDEPSSVPAPLPVEKRFEWVSSPAVAGADVVFIALHGGDGENGVVQGVLEMAGIPYTGTSVLGSALAMNKDRAKALFREAGVNTARHVLVGKSLQSAGFGTQGKVERNGSLFNVGGIDVDASELPDMVEEKVGFPVVVKPNSQGSSVGFSFVKERSAITDAIVKAMSYGGGVIVERYIPGREITVAVLNGKPLPIVEIVPEGGFYDYRRKYTKGTSRYIVPAEIEGTLAGRIQAEGVRAYNALSCRDYARVDFRLSEDGESFCLEVNTLPGMTELSLVPMAAREAGMEFDDLVETVARMAYSRKERMKQGE